MRIIYAYNALIYTRENVNPHTYFDEDKLATLFDIAKTHSHKAHALVQLLYGGALRI